jgi:hypothetical protein
MSVQNVCTAEINLLVRIVVPLKAWPIGSLSFYVNTCTYLHICIQVLQHVQPESAGRSVYTTLCSYFFIHLQLNLHLHAPEQV